MQVASLIAFMPAPGFSVYAASKAYVLSLGQALAYAYKDQGITVTTVCPGLTQTEFFNRAASSEAAYQSSFTMSAEAVAKGAYAAMIKGKVLYIAGWRNKILRHLIQLIPRKLLMGGMAMRYRRIQEKSTEYP